MRNVKHLDIKTAFAINFFFLLVCILFGEKFVLGNSDDFFMARILEGVYGDTYNVRMPFVNVLYGYALLPLYHLFPKVGWYYIGEVFSVFISFTTISYFVIKRMGFQWGTFLSIMIVACFARDFYLTIQFTQCAAALGAAGMLVFLDTLDGGLQKKKNIVFAFILALWGYSMRTDAFLMGLPFFAFALLFFARKAYGCKYRFGLCVLILFCGLWGAKSLNASHYSSPEYVKYSRFQPHRVMLGDKANYNKGAVYDEIEETGIYGEDYSLLMSWNFYDTDIFSTDSLKRITDKILKYTPSIKWSVIPYSFLYHIETSILHPCCWAFCLTSLVLLFMGGKRSFYVYGAFVVMLAMIGYLIYLSRLLYRVETGFWIYATVLAVPLLKNVRPISCRTFYTIAVSLLIAYMGYFYLTRSYQRSPSSGRMLQVSHREKIGNNYREVFEYMDSFPDNTLFLVSMSVYQSFSQYRAPLYYSEPFGCWKNIVSLGFWTPYYPDVENSLKQYGVENPMRDVVKENVVVISYDEILLDYLHRHYYENAKVDTLRNIGNVKFFKYSKMP